MGEEEEQDREEGREQGVEELGEEEISFSRKLATLTAHSRHFTSFSGGERRSGEAVINVHRGGRQRKQKQS